MNKLWLILALAAALPAQDEARLVRVKYADPMAVMYLVRPFGVNAMPDAKLKVITISGKRPNLDAAEAAIKELDVPSAAPKDVDLTAYFVIGTDESAATAGGSAIPPDLQGTVTELKRTFPFKTYTLLDALSVRSRSGSRAEVSGQLSGDRITDFSVSSANVEADGMLRLDHLRARLRLPKTFEKGQTSFVDIPIETDVVDVKDGQKLVIGRSSLEGAGKALFLVLIARVAP
jgi:hypothetical protein